MIPFAMPFPPSGNNLFMNVPGQGRIRSPKYRAWQAQAVATVQMQRPARVSGLYALTVIATRPDRRRRDLDNLAKSVSDALTKAGVISDDSNAQRITLEWAPGEPVKGGALTVTVEPA